MTRIGNRVLTLAVISQSIVVSKPFSTISATKRLNLSVLLPKVVPHTLSAEKPLSTQITLVPTFFMAFHVLRQADFLNKGQVASLMAALVFSFTNMGFQVTRQAPDLQPTEEALNFAALVAARDAGGMLAQLLQCWELHGAGGAGEALDFTTVHQPGNRQSSVFLRNWNKTKSQVGQQ